MGFILRYCDQAGNNKNRVDKTIVISGYELNCLLDKNISTVGCLLLVLHLG